ncbi:integrase core domain-containing protein [Hydrogenimonas sp.]
MKYEEVYVKEYENVKELRKGIETFIDFYNYNRLHSALKYDRPMNVYRRSLAKAA